MKVSDKGQSHCRSQECCNWMLQATNKNQLSPTSQLEGRSGRGPPVCPPSGLILSTLCGVLARFAQLPGASHFSPFRATLLLPTVSLFSHLLYQKKKRRSTMLPGHVARGQFSTTCGAPGQVSAIRPQRHPALAVTRHARHKTLSAATNEVHLP